MTDTESRPLEVVAGNEDRQCYICLETAQVGAGEEDRWVSPCRCRGTMAWVHQECLLHWIHELEHQNFPVACAQCHTLFVLIPEKGPVLFALDVLYKRVVPFCKYVAGGLVVVIYSQIAYAAVGVSAMVQVYGVHETITILTDLEVPLAHLQLISCSLVLINYLPWEDCLLQALRSASNLPLLGAVLPADLPVHFQDRPRKKSIQRILADSVLLPVFANVVGILFFSAVQSPVSRILVGGAAFLAVKCTLFMYLSQKKLRRQQQIQVLPLDFVAEPIQ